MHGPHQNLIVLSQVYYCFPCKHKDRANVISKKFKQFIVHAATHTYVKSLPQMSSLCSDRILRLDDYITDTVHSSISIVIETGLERLISRFRADCFILCHVPKKTCCSSSKTEFETTGTTGTFSSRVSWHGTMLNCCLSSATIWSPTGSTHPHSLHMFLIFGQNTIHINSSSSTKIRQQNITYFEMSESMAGIVCLNV